MAFFSPTSLRQAPPRLASAIRPVCPACRRTFTATLMPGAGHNKWSKTKHIKNATAAKRSTHRAQYGKMISLYSRLYGPDPGFNPKLASTIAEAKKGGVPKANIEQAIARGQGRSSSGKALEPVTVEAKMPGGVALMLDIETDARTKIKGDFSRPLRRNGGSLGSSAYFFDRKGRAVFAPKDGVDEDTALEPAIDCGAEDVEVDDGGNITVRCPPTELSRVTEGMTKALDLTVLESSIIWDPKEELIVKLDSAEDAEQLATFLDVIVSEVPDIQGIYANAVQGSISDEKWEAVVEHLD